MRRLILIRHAKSDWGTPGLPDHERPLAPRGQRAAGWIGDVLRVEGWVPDAVLCSTALRTRQTLELAGLDVPVSFERDIYDAMSDDFIDIIRTKGGDAPVLGLIGHNTGMETTALLLAEDEVDFGGYPTGAVAVLDFDIASWAELQEGTGKVVAFRWPRGG
ncbi:MAG: SixA phosphatase family protein [Devosia sp.]